MAPPSRRFEALARHLDALASETRLELLHALRTPQALQDIRVGASLTRGDENPERALSRQAVARHLDTLRDLGLVRRVPAEGRLPDTWVLNHERLFAMVDEIRGLAKLRPAVQAAGPGETLGQEGPGGTPLPRGPRLVLAYGRDDGLSFSLAGPVGARWRIGRAPACEVRLDYDPYSSAENTVVERTEEGYTVADLGGRNGTHLNGERLPREHPSALAPGDLLGVGRSLLVFQDRR